MSQNAPDCISAHFHFKTIPEKHAPRAPWETRSPRPLGISHSNGKSKIEPCYSFCNCIRSWHCYTFAQVPGLQDICCLRADVSYFLCTCATKEMGNVCTQVRYLAIISGPPLGFMLPLTKTVTNFRPKSEVG